MIGKIIAIYPTDKVVPIKTFEWWICPDGHVKMLSENRPICPICNVAMQNEIEQKRTQTPTLR